MCTHKRVELVFENILRIEIAMRSVVKLWPEVRDCVAASEFQRDQVVDFVLADRVVTDSILLIHATLFGFRHVANAFRVTRTTDRRDVHVEHATR
jgi:hypothetical protein